MAAACILVAAVVGLALLVVCLAWDRPSGSRPRAASLPPLHGGYRPHPSSATRPTSSNRKSGRGRA